MYNVNGCIDSPPTFSGLWYFSPRQLVRTLQFENLTIVAVGESIYIYIYMAEWGTWCCSVSMVWVQILSRGEQNLSVQKISF
jgi:hypothetical protein